MSDFDQLLAEINLLAEEHSALAKSLPEGSAEEGKDDEEDENQEGGEQLPGGEGGEGEGSGDGNPLQKSMTVDGEEVQVIDADELVKSVNALAERVGLQDQNLVKSMEPMLALVKGQGALLKSMQAQLDKLGGQGRGRKTVLTISERPSPAEPLQKSQPEAMPSGQILAKALDAQRAGKISAVDVARAENAIQSGSAVPADVLARI